MKQGKEPPTAQIVWLDEKNKILSFQRMPGARGKKFATRAAMLAFALEQCSNGFRIQ